MKTCSVPGCSGKHLARGYCAAHYDRMRRYGDLNYRKRTAGVSGHPLYQTWCGMKGRCHNPHHADYPSYGARGITVCDRWRYDFTVFLADMGERPEGMTLDRIDPDGPYSPENCRWATAKEQRTNQSAAGDKRQRDGARAGALRRHHGLSTVDNTTDI